MDFSEIPLWFILVCAAVSILLGVGLRRWLDRREAREAQRAKEKSKEIKKQMKRQRKLAKKSGNRKKSARQTGGDEPAP